MRTPLRDAISCACPKSPKPVTSVTAFGSNGRSASAAAALRVVIHSIASAASIFAASTRPVPSGFVRKSASPGRAPDFGQMPSG